MKIECIRTYHLRDELSEPFSYSQLTFTSRNSMLVEVISDSSYVVKGINEWLEGWIKRNFAKVKNPDLWKDYIQSAKGHKIKATWVRGHDGHEENERCDDLARATAEKFKAKLSQ